MLENGGQNVEIGDPTLENRSLALENGSRRMETGIRKPVSTEGAASIRRPASEDSDGPWAQYMYRYITKARRWRAQEVRRLKTMCNELLA